MQRAIIGAWAGAMLAAVLVIAYDTSADVSVIEGGHAHLRWSAIVGYIVGAAFVGAFAAGFVAKRPPWPPVQRRDDPGD